MSTSTILTIKDMAVAQVKSDNGPQGAREAFNKLEAKMNTLRGKKMYGVFYQIAGDYFACVELDEEHANDMGFGRGIIPGGLYARRKINDWEKHVSEIGPTFGAIIKETQQRGYEIDAERPNIEFYRSQKELLLMLPIKK